MRARFLVIGLTTVLLLTTGWVHGHAAEKKASEAKQVKQTKQVKQAKADECYACHSQIQELHTSGKHAKVECSSCHKGIDKHLANPGPETRPVTDMAWETCGQCHKLQYVSFKKLATHRPARDEKSQLTNRAPNPMWDKLMMGHGFTKEHGLTRSHVNMLTDQFIVDRAFGGRFEPKKGWNYIFETGKTWDTLQDKEPSTNVQKVFKPQTAIAANPVCLQCKTQDQILDWAYMGEPGKGAKWSRTSSVVELARSVQHGLNCFTCHDPHAAKPRIVRDALIDALTRKEADTLWHNDPNRTKIQVIEMGARGYTRKIAILPKYDSRLLCGQCHVEYNCNPGYDPKNQDLSKPTVTMQDPRTNHFPFKDVFGLYDHYKNQISFLDWKHGLTGGLLWKAQHPEAETYYNSKHAKAGVQCDDCHTPKMKDKKTGKVYTSHFAVTPRVMLKETCLKCHKTWTEEEAKYSIDSIKAYTKGRLRKAEFWLASLIDAIVEAKKSGVDQAAIAEAQDQHLKAHILWEFWTAENSDGFHNPEMARDALTRSVDESQKGIDILQKAVTAKK